jgi:transposase
MTESRTRSATVPLAHFAELETTQAIVVCDCYSAYKKLARLNAAIILAFCWAYVRRDFLEIAAGSPTLKKRALDWVAEIGTLCHLNRLRLAQRQETLPLAEQSLAFQQEQKRLESRIKRMITRCDLLLQAD